jgi:hypothetical protein
MSGPKQPEDFHHSGPTMDSEGRLVGKPAAPAGEGAFEPPKEQAASLELDTSRMRKGPSDWAEPAPYRDDVSGGSKRRVLRVLSLAVAALGAAAVAAFMLMPSLQHALPFKLPTGPSRSLLITSEPSGADVRIDGSKVGQTPFAQDNRFNGKVQLELRLEGYEPFRDTFSGGRDVHIAATLRPRSVK